jgi:hypothetical protein
VEQGCQTLGRSRPITTVPGLWWTHERLHRAVIRDFATRLPLYKEERDSLESAFLSEAAGVYARYREAGPEERAAALLEFTFDCFRRAAVATESWTKKVMAEPVQHRPSLRFAASWSRFNKQAGFPQEG